ncbi:unnamed protein product, partial [Ectocarpus sp. 6 AP-2014]
WPAWCRRPSTCVSSRMPAVCSTPAYLRSWARSAGSTVPLKAEGGVDRLVAGHYIHRCTDRGRESEVDVVASRGRVGREW